MGDSFSSPIIETRLRIPPVRAKLVQRPRLTTYIEHVNSRTQAVARAHELQL